MSNNALRVYASNRGIILKSAIALLTCTTLSSVLWTGKAKADHHTQSAQSEQCLADGLRQAAADEVAVLEGGIFIGFSDDGQRLETRSTQNNRTIAYDFNGEKIAEAEEGFFVGSSHIVLAQEEAPVYDLEGSEVGSFAGGPSISFNVGGHLVTASFMSDQSVLYDSLGNRIAVLQGVAMSATERGILTSSHANDSIFLYSLEGEELSRLKGTFRSFEELHIATSSPSTDQAYLYDQIGQLIAEVEGAFLIFSQESLRVATSPGENGTGALYDLNNNKVTELVGSFPAFSNDGEWLTSTVDIKQ